MQISISNILLSTVGATFLAPLLRLVWKRLFRQKPQSLPKTIGDFENRILTVDKLIFPLSIISFIFPFSTYLFKFSEHNPWPLLFSFGSALVIPALFVLVATLPSGIGAFRNFLEFYEQKHSTNRYGLFVGLLGGLLLFCIAGYRILVQLL